MKVQKYFMRTQMHGTPTGRPDYYLVFIGFNLMILKGLGKTELEITLFHEY